MKGGSLSVLFAFATVFLILFVTIPQSGSAIPYRVEGYLKDDAGNPISGADIQVRGQIFVFNGTDQSFEFRTATFHDETDPSGKFDIMFGVDEPDGFITGNTVTVFYTDESREATQSLTIAGDRTWLNLTAVTQTSNDDLTYPLIIVVTIIVVFILVIALFRYRDSVKEEEETKEEAKTKVGRRRK